MFIISYLAFLMLGTLGILSLFVFYLIYGCVFINANLASKLFGIVIFVAWYFIIFPCMTSSFDILRGFNWI